MADTISVSYVSKLTTTKTPGDSYAQSGGNLKYQGLDNALTLNGSSTPTATVIATARYTMTGSAVTIDLTSITDVVSGAVQSGSGLKIVACKFRNKSTNANSISIVPGASNDYDLLGSDMKITLSPSDEVLIFVKNGQTIGSSHKTLDATGTNTQILEVEFIFGT